jgi:uncharacterized damage-inducible protein DinB
MTPERAFIVRWWDEAWRDGLWAAAWSKALDGLTADQACWRPLGRDGTPRHSIHQYVLHMCFWREGWLRRVATGVKLSAAEVAAGSFPDADPSEAAWSATRARFQDTQARVLDTLRTRGPEADTMIYFLPHDCYHFGQIMLIRGLLGLPPIE